MKKILGTLILICFALSTNAQLLWKISGNGLNEPSFVMGTHQIDHRNKKWANMLPEIMNTAPTFIAVGVLHLPGENGLINFLKQQGYSVEAVK